MTYCKKFLDCFWHGFFHDHSARVPICEKETDLCSAVSSAEHCESCKSFISTNAVFAQLNRCFNNGQNY